MTPRDDEPNHERAASQAAPTPTATPAPRQVVTSSSSGAQSPSAQPPVLEYHRPRRRIIWTALLAVAVVISIVVGGMKTWSRHQARQAANAQAAGAAAAALRASQQAQQQAERQARMFDACRTHTAPADQVILETDPKRALALLRANPDYKPLFDDRHAALTPASWQFVGRWPIYPDADTAGGFGLRPAGVAFLHERRADLSSAPAVVRVQVGFIRIGRPVLNPLIVRGYSGRAVAPPELGIMLDPKDDLRVFAGQPDPADGSHFTIEYELNARRGVIDGWLLPKDALKLAPRGGNVFQGPRFPVWQPPESLRAPVTAAEAAAWPN